MVGRGEIECNSPLVTILFTNKASFYIFYNVLENLSTIKGIWGPKIQYDWSCIATIYPKHHTTIKELIRYALLSYTEDDSTAYNDVCLSNLTLICSCAAGDMMRRC